MALLGGAGIARSGKSGLPDCPAPGSGQARVAFPFRPAGAKVCTAPPSGFAVDVDPVTTEPGMLAGPAAFLADVAYGVVPLEALAAIIGRFALAAGLAPEGASITIDAGRRQATHRPSRRDLTIEETAFGAAHVLYEDGQIGCYILEIAPGRSIPTHCHHVMREWELILDNGLLQQGDPVPPGAAFAWPLGHVHVYRNPTARALRILCIDSPRFDPADERPLVHAPRIQPLSPFADYPV